MCWNQFVLQIRGQVFTRNWERRGGRGSVFQISNDHLIRSILHQLITRTCICIHIQIYIHMIIITWNPIQLARYMRIGRLNGRIRGGFGWTLWKEENLWEIRVPADSCFQWEIDTLSRTLPMTLVLDTANTLIEWNLPGLDRNLIATWLKLTWKQVDFIIFIRWKKGMLH